MNPIDGAGNMLNEKDFVAVQVNAGILTGVINKIKEASIVLASKEPVVGSVTINIPVTIVFLPHAPRVSQVFKLVKPPNYDAPH